MQTHEYEAMLRRASGLDVGLNAADEKVTQASLSMLSHRLFDTTREVFCGPSPSDTDRIFGVDTENEQFYERAVERIKFLSSSGQRQAHSILSEAVRIAGTWGHSRAERQESAHVLIRAVDVVLETLHRLGPPIDDPARSWQTRRPAF